MSLQDCCAIGQYMCVQEAFMMVPFISTPWFCAGRANKARPYLKDDAGAVTDKAYEREYLAHDRKRIRRD